ncbi:uncharacterized protein DFL_007011 [Arthrobotrys flagrans]|uniref:Ubiquitin 3 binding protein But2 C-terminal domain-containing protein n=1 Tax=Arthrobotrys flagrans TaxID=97331 RepID=A0A436ZUH3_ARTFL|nr:hypothetical protein DFL_007011 [Arthrobotrys flagrans]
MRYTTFLFLISAVSAAVPAVTLKCNADNCLRAIRATAPVFLTREQSADCSSFFQSYHTSTVTAEATHTPKSATTTVVSAVDAFGVEHCTPIPPPPKLPSYATPCSNAARFSSACACIGVKETATPVTITTTVEAPSADGIATVTATSFYIKIQETTEPRYLSAVRIDGDDYGTSVTEDITKALVFHTTELGGIYYGYPEDSSYFCSINPDLSLVCESDEDAPVFTSFGFIPEQEADGLTYPPIVLAGKEGIVWADYGIQTIQLQVVPIAPAC